MNNFAEFVKAFCDFGQEMVELTVTTRWHLHQVSHTLQSILSWLDYETVLARLALTVCKENIFGGERCTLIQTTVQLVNGWTSTHGFTSTHRILYLYYISANITIL